MKKVSIIILLSVQLYIAHSQNVGIGISNPSRAKLELNGSVGKTNAIFGGETSGISLQSNWPTIGFNQYYDGGSKYIASGFAAAQYLDPSTGVVAFDIFGAGTANAYATSTNRVFTIAGNGNIGIKVNPSNASLYVAKGGNFDGAAVFGGTSYNSHFNHSAHEDTYLRAGKNFGNVFINDIQQGNILMGAGASRVGINTSNPGSTFEIKQINNSGLTLVNPLNFSSWEIFSGTTTNLHLFFGGGQKGYFRSDNGNYYTVSDKRLKTNIHSMPTLLGKIMQLKPVEYEMNQNNPGHQKSIGFIAQDVKKIFPELVTVVPDMARGYKDIPDLHSIDYSGFGILAIKAIQEQQQQIDKLLQEIELLKKQNKMLGKLNH
ncbi:MAG: tail fiber domain-containing protein [Rhizobacter sp.]|nr:tail fiber domain-containing protein [Ferruginibacter sp.]